MPEKERLFFLWHRKSGIPADAAFERGALIYDIESSLPGKREEVKPAGMGLVWTGDGRFSL